MNVDLLCRTQVAQAHSLRSYTVCFVLLLCKCSAKRDMEQLYYYLTTELDHTKHDSLLAAYEGVVLQWFECLNS